MNTKNAMKHYTVPISADVQMTLTGDVLVYATSPKEAAAKVEQQMLSERVDPDLEMEDFNTLYTMSYRDAARLSDTLPEIVETDITVDEDEEVDAAEVLDAEVKELQASISSDMETQGKLKAFLETLVPKGAK